MKIVEPIRSIEKLEAFKNVLHSKPRDYLLALIGLNSGLRIGDIIKLRVRDVKDRTHVEINEQKTGKSKKFLLNNTLRNLISDFCSNLDREEFLFRSRQGNGHLGRFRAYQILNAAAREVGIGGRIGCHSLRKTFGFHFYQKTKDIAMLMEMFNHASQAVTLRYVGLTQDARDRAMEGFDL